MEGRQRIGDGLLRLRQRETGAVVEAVTPLEGAAEGTTKDREEARAVEVEAVGPGHLLLVPLLRVVLRMEKIPRMGPNAPNLLLFLVSRSRTR